MGSELIMSIGVRKYLFTQVIDALDVVEFTNRPFAGMEQVCQNNFALLSSALAR